MNKSDYIQPGSAAVFEKMYYEFHEKLYYYFLKRTGSADITQELVQLTFIKAWRYFDHFDENIPVARQLFRIARTTLIDVLRQKAQQRSVPVDPEMPSAEPDMSTGLIYRDNMQLIHRAMESLPAERKRIFQYRINGLTNKEIAEELSLSVKTVENQVNRAIKQIREVLVLLCIISLL
ncbi:RNA polymerase sigma factor [Chitinophaga sp. 22321]|uniref:Sigma-70 family RNA polymerase sigma factor n=1 Tax=Chitinophaga hostae TaxID=2831022 RepID=A0ABS5J246_9BACT|nr:sigma-70 family RNA polymerase sigma factor [Chitinophaga hostae]MBS0029220.1 sigma-70 family RNA polymerase sigma factor [Chitinophaga hostae]